MKPTFLPRSRLATFQVVNLLWILGMICLVSCSQSDYDSASVSPSASNTKSPIIAMPTPRHKPEFIAATWPESNMTLTRNQYWSYDFRATNWPEVYDQEWDVPPQPSICVWIDLKPILEEGDDYSEGIATRASLIIDGNRIHPTEPDFGLLIDLHVEIFRDDWNTPAVYPAWPNQLCWYVDLVPGVHTIKVNLQKISGDLVDYTWFVGIVDE